MQTPLAPTSGTPYPSMLAQLNQLASRVTGNLPAVPVPVAVPVAMPAAVAYPTATPVVVSPPVAIPAVSVPTTPTVTTQGGLSATGMLDQLREAYQNLTRKLSDLVNTFLKKNEDAKKAEVDKKAAEEKASAEKKAAEKAAAEKAQAGKKASQATYTVQKGDSLSAIAARTLGDANRWREIYDLNRDVVGGNPNLIYPGQVLKLPGGAKASAPSNSSSGGRWPKPVAGPITSPYGMRKHPITGKYSMHTGLDIGAATGTPIQVVKSGRVTFAGWNGGYGNYVVVDHGNGLQTAYAHLSKINVSVGQQISARQVIGKVGSTGMSTGPHLHFEVKKNGNFVNPADYLA